MLKFFIRRAVGGFQRANVGAMQVLERHPLTIRRGRGAVVQGLFSSGLQEQPLSGAQTQAKEQAVQRAVDYIQKAFENAMNIDYFSKETFVYKEINTSLVQTSFLVKTVFEKADKRVQAAMSFYETATKAAFQDKWPEVNEAVIDAMLVIASASLITQEQYELLLAGYTRLTSTDYKFLYSNLQY